MHFGVDAHAIGRRLTGNEVYVRNLLHGFASLDQCSRFTAYYCEADAPACIPERFQTRSVPSNPFLRLGFGLPWQLRVDRPDLLHVQYTAPVSCPVPTIVSVHDISYLDCPEFFEPARALQLRLTVRRSVLRAARVLAPSEFSRLGVLREYGIGEDKVSVVPMAVSSAFRPIPQGLAASRLERFGIQAPFLLCVGDLQPRKNHVGLIEAYNKLIHDNPQFPQHLVIVGKDTWYAPKVKEAAARSPYANRIHFPGWVSDEELLNFYNACEVFVFPSLYEGFGMPILEAMACGRAVACSSTSAMPEVANATALLFSPQDRDEIVRAIRDLLVNPEICARLERLGQQRAAAFGWINTAQKTLDAYYEVAGERSKARVGLARTRHAR